MNRIYRMAPTREDTRKHPVHPVILSKTPRPSSRLQPRASTGLRLGPSGSGKGGWNASHLASSGHRRGQGPAQTLDPDPGL